MDFIKLLKIVYVLEVQYLFTVLQNTFDYLYHCGMFLIVSVYLNFVAEEKDRGVMGSLYSMY